MTKLPQSFTCMHFWLDQNIRSINQNAARGMCICHGCLRNHTLPRAAKAPIVAGTPPLGNVQIDMSCFSSPSLFAPYKFTRNFVSWIPAQACSSTASFGHLNKHVQSSCRILFSLR